MKQISIITILLLFSSGCVVAGGYTSGGGRFIWPGTSGISEFVEVSVATNVKYHGTSPWHLGI